MGQRPLDPSLADEAVIAWRKNNFNKTMAARSLGISLSTFRHRIAAAQTMGLALTTDAKNPLCSVDSSYIKNQSARKTDTIETGHIVVFSDAHFWPGEKTPAYKALLKIIKDLKPKIVVANGDIFDGAVISRHASIGWEKKPSVIDELNVCKERMDEIRCVSGKAKLYWPMGNHDQRFETRLANSAPEYAKVHGVHLQDHFPDWLPCWSLFVNSDIVIKHRLKNGIHATHNNAMASGKTILTGHLHSPKVTPVTDYNGTRYGVDTGTLIDCLDREPAPEQCINYLEDGPVNWRSGFIVLTFYKGFLLMPEICSVIDRKTAQFRGSIIKL